MKVDEDGRFAAEMERLTSVALGLPDGAAREAVIDQLERHLDGTPMSRDLRFQAVKKELLELLRELPEIGDAPARAAGGRPRRGMTAHRANATVR